MPRLTPQNVATLARWEFGLEAAQVMLGHQRGDVTQIYAEKRLEVSVMIAEVGDASC
jgi:hypothetical protein